DLLCNRAAATAGLGGTWIAWLSDSTVNAIDRVHDVGPWYGIDGAEIFANKAAFTGDPLVGILINEHGTTTDYAPWTGTLPNGTVAPDTCKDWRSNTA